MGLFCGCRGSCSASHALSFSLMGAERARGSSRCRAVPTMRFFYAPCSTWWSARMMSMASCGTGASPGAARESTSCPRPRAASSSLRCAGRVLLAQLRQLVPQLLDLVGTNSTGRTDTEQLCCDALAVAACQKTTIQATLGPQLIWWPSTSGGRRHWRLDIRTPAKPRALSGDGLWRATARCPVRMCSGR
jgi:hypothetical protein